MIKFFISATTLLMNTTASLPPYTIIEDQSNLPLLNPDLSSRETLKIELQNGLKALLISDPNIDQSAAAVRVEIGSWNDPAEYPGMAHFCEHMLFMGTEKYPNENEFSSMISDYAGLTNAFTAPNRTVYMFSAQTSGFLALLDQFAHFFIDPLFNPDNVAREMIAVDQEFAKNIEHDAWREYMVFKETANPDHPIRFFSTGNSETLGKIPQNALKNWHKDHYGAERMHLVIYSPLSMEVLQEEVVKIFSAVPKAQKEPLDTTGPLSSKEQLGSIAYIEPIQNRQTLTLSWELPEGLSQDETKSIDLLAYAIRSGQEKSLQQCLVKEGLIDSLSVRVDEMGGMQHRFFQMSLELTQKGIEEIEKTILRCFSAIARVKKEGVPLYLFEEKNAMAKINYQYQERQNPFDYITKLADSVAEEPLHTYPQKTLLSLEYSPEKIGAAASLLTPKTCFISLLAPEAVTHIKPDRKEKWLGAEYSLSPIPSDWMESWSQAKPLAAIQTPPPNPFVPKHLTIQEDPSQEPHLIAESEIGTAYYVRCPEFGTPESVYHLHILSPHLSTSAKSSTLASLYIDHITDVLAPTLSSANAAGLFCDLSFSRCALHLKIAGYSEKAPLLLQELVRQMPKNPPTKEQFITYFNRHKKAYENADKELAARQAKEFLDSLLYLDVATRKEKLDALQNITYEEFLRFHQNLFQTTYLKALFAGNLSQKQAESAWLDVVHTLGKEPFVKEEHYPTQVLRLPSMKGPFQITKTTEVQGNAALLLIDQGDFTHENRAAQDVLRAAVKEPFFSELRSRQKTGYIAQSDASEAEERLFQYFIVQSNSHQPQELLFRFEQFIEQFQDELTLSFPQERFETVKQSLISSLQNRFRNLSIKSALWNHLCFHKGGDFDFIQKRIDALSALSYDTFLQKSLEFLNRQNRRRLAILFEGRLHSPFMYQVSSASEIQEIATYEPKKPLSEDLVLKRVSTK